MKKILLIATIYRVGEKIYPIIPKLSTEFEIDVFKTAQMGDKINWYGDVDLRDTFDKKYNDYVDNIFYTTPNLKEYDLILMDDNRPRNGLKEIWNEANRYDIPVLACQHGNDEMYKMKPDLRQAGRESWDYISVFGHRELDLYEKELPSNHLKDRILLGGIPSNDLLEKYKKTEEHILVITNLLDNRQLPNFNWTNCCKGFNGNVFDQMGIVELQKAFNKKVVIKIKSRLDHPYPDEDFNYLKSVIPKDLDYDILMDVENDNKLISDSFVVISSSSTMAFKPVQKGIPTIILNGYGVTGSFDNFKGLVDLDTQKIFDEIERQYNEGKDENFIKYNVEGGIDFTCTEKYINNIKGLL